MLKQNMRQINQYDKVFRENMEEALPGLISKLLDIQAVRTEEIPDDIQHTKERKPDVLKKVTDQKGRVNLLHIEFQVKNEREMVYRMAEYYIMLLRKYKVEVLQYVIYIGGGKPGMKDHISSEVMNYKYRLIALSAVDYKLLLKSGKPEEKMLAILADFGDGDPTLIVENIVTQVLSSSQGNFAKLRHMRQLLIMAQLRNFKPESLQIMESIASFFSEEKDILYKRGQVKGLEKGISKGIEKGQENTVRILLLNTDFSITKIAELAEVTVAFVKKIKKALK